MAKRRIRFNRVSVATMAELRRCVEDPIEAKGNLGRDFLPSWEVVATERDDNGTRVLLRASEGGLAWLHVDREDMAYDCTRIADDEARELWPRLILQFTPEEANALTSALKTGEKLESALETALGFRRKARSTFLSDQPADDGTTLRRCLVRNGGIVAAWVTDNDGIVRSELVTGEDAWNTIKHFIDP